MKNLKTQFFKKRIFSLFLFLALFSTTWAQIPVGYYDSADGKSGAELKTAMHEIVRNFINLDFSGFTATFWGENYFRRTDWHPEGHFWDMYSDHRRTVYNSGLMDREHLMPRSWWQDNTISGFEGGFGRANSDLHNLFPADGVANGRKSNHPLGVTDNPRWTNGVVRVGNNSFSADFTGIVFEPADEYKGDFARTYFYMVTSFEDYADRWRGEALNVMNNETYPVFKDWMIEMLLEWHRNDPVSQKEIDRNDSVFVLQQNRNPFIDIPELAEYIWGNRRGYAISIPNQATQPTLITPSADGVMVNFGVVRPLAPERTRMIPVRGTRLTQPLTIDFLENASGYFSVQGQITVAQANAVGGYFLPIVYYPANEGKHTAMLRISSPELAQPVIVFLQGEQRPVPPPVQPVYPTADMEVVIFHYGTSATGAWAIPNLPQNFTTNARGGTGGNAYANGDFGFRNNGEYLIVEFDEEAHLLQFSIRPYNAWGDNENSLLVFEGVDKYSFGEMPIADFNSDFVINGAGYNNTPEIPLRSDTRAIRIEYVKQAQNAGINNLIIARRKEGTSVNENHAGSVRVFHTNGLLHIHNARVGETVYVYNLLGYLIATKTITEQQTVIPMYEKGVFLLKTNSGVYKFMAF